MKKIVLTGARGNLGMELRAPLAALADELVSTDISPAPETLLPNETFVQADIAERAAVAKLLAGAEMVVHFGAVVDERPFEDLLGPNFVGAYNIWEEASLAGVRRVIYASSVHAIGMHETNRPASLADHRPDTFYGLAKCFTEDMARMYWEKRGLEAVCLRIFSCTPEPQNLRALSTWLSYADMSRAVSAAIKTPVTGFAVAWAVSNNDRAPVPPGEPRFLGFRPQDNAEDWAKELEARLPMPDAQDLGFTRLGGPFAKVPLGESGVAALKKMSKT